MTKKFKNYYFSGTGNTKLMVECFSNYLNELGYESSIYKIEDDISFNNTDNFILGLMFPVAVQSTFPLVWDFINNLPAGYGRDVFMFETMEEFSGGVVGPVKKILEAISKMPRHCVENDSS